MSSTIDYEKLKLFYIGKEKIDEDVSIPLVYKNKDLRTHAAIIGMTGMPASANANTVANG